MIGFTGTRRGMTNKQMSMLKLLLRKIFNDSFQFVHGGARGADTQADEIAREIGYDIYIRPTEETYWNWMKKKRNVCTGKPPLERNKDIVANVRSFLIAAPKSLNEERRSGTWATIRYARETGVLVVILDP